MRKGRFLMKGLKVIGVCAFILFTIQGTAAGGGPFGPPQPLSKEEGGLATAIGYWRYEDEYTNGKGQVIRQNQIYSQLGYGKKNWEIFGRIGIADLKISDAFRSTLASTVTSKNDFEDNWNGFGTMGAKGFYPFNDLFGIGAFFQGSTSFRNFTDHVSGTSNGAPFQTELKVSRFWEVNFGLGFQVAVPHGLKLYAGPYACYSEATVSLSPTIPGLTSEPGSFRIHNRTNIGGFGGVYLPLARGFHLNIEGQYSEKFSFGTAVTYSY